MASSYVVVDGSNIATEGRSVPSLAQLDDAVRQFQREFPEAEVIVVVDASFGRRIDPAERAAFEDAVAHGELVSPPAGAAGRGDAFLLRIAERVGGRVLSNDSFQEFHGEHPWLFDEGRLIGGKPVPGVGWFFMPRSPVRGARSRAARSGANVPATATRRGASDLDRPAKAKAAKAGAAKALKAGPSEKPEVPKAEKAKKAEKKAAKTAKTAKTAETAKTAKVGDSRRVGDAGAAKPAKASNEPGAGKGPAAGKAAKAAKTATKAAPAKELTPGKEAKRAKAAKAPKAAKPSKSGRGTKSTGAMTPAPHVRAAIDAATVEVTAPSAEATGGGSRPRSKAPVPAAVNDPLTFLTFVSEHPLGSSVQGEVASFVSHGAMVNVDAMQCYVPLAGLGSPPPRRAREVLERGERRTFVVVALDPPRRGAELALPDIAPARLAARRAAGNEA